MNISRLKTKIKKSAFILISLLFVFSCQSDKPERLGLVTYSLKKPDFIPEFNSQNAFDDVKKQVLFGPRNPNSTGHSEALSYLYNELRQYTPHVSKQEFTYTGYDGEELLLTNLIAKFNPSSPNRILLCAHWDTRPRAERDPEFKDKPLPGANDGASGTAILLETARNLKAYPLPYGVDIVLFDGEDYGKPSDLSNYCLGSKFFAAKKGKDYRPVFAILLDLVGDKNALFYREAYSEKYAPDINKIVWDTAAAIGLSKFINRIGGSVYDDHIPLNQAGIRTINIVDIELINKDNSGTERDYWHTQGDTVDKIGVETLGQVGSLVNNLLFSIKFEPHE